MVKNPSDLHLDILSQPTRKALEELSTHPWLEESDWYLAGGTALALQANHRISYDLDFFTSKADFDNTQLLNYFANNKNWETTVNKKGTIYGSLFEAKVSFIAYPFFVPKQEFLHYGAIKLLSAVDIAVMKVIAISQRGRKRDFYDLFWCAQHLTKLEEIIKKLPVQYPNLVHNYNHILTSLVYFVDAESDPKPEVLFATEWGEIKAYFTAEVPRITGTVLELNS